MTVPFAQKKTAENSIQMVSATSIQWQKGCNSILLMGHPRDRASITWQIGARRTNHDRESGYE